MNLESTPIDQRTPHQIDSTAPPPGNDVVMTQLLREMRAQRESQQAEQERTASERKIERRWKLFFQGLFFGAPLLLGILYFLFFLNTTGFSFGPMHDVVGLVTIEGQISHDAKASADKVIESMERAFADSNVKAVILSIDSPGGAPVEAERINNAIARLKKKHNKQVVAVISNIGASAGYMIALHADKIVAGKYSLVGSIGAIMAPWDLHKAIAKLDVSQRVYASGKLKSFLNPFTPVSPEVDAKAKKLVEQMGQTFLDELKLTRGAFLKKNIDYGSGEVWSGLEAKEIGLIDAIGTVDEVATSTWGLKTYDFGPHERGFGGMSTIFRSAFLGALSEFAAQQNFHFN